MQPGFGEQVEGVAAFGVQQVMHQFDVHQGTFERKPLCGQLLVGFLQVIAVFGDGGVGQQFADRGGRNAADRIVRSHPDRFALTHQGQFAAFARGGGYLVHAGLPPFEGHRSVLDRFGTGYVGDITSERSELVVVEQFRNVRGIVGIELHLGGLYLQRDIGFDGYQVVAQSDMRAGFLEQLPLARGQFVQVGVDVLDRAVCADEIGGAHLADALHAGHVVGGVAAEGEHLDNLQG